MSVCCTMCGNRRTETTNYCAHCEAGFEESRPTRKTEAPAGHEAAWFVGATVVLAVVVVVGILGANAVITDAIASVDYSGTGYSTDDSNDSASDSRGEGSFIGSDGFITPGQADPTIEAAPTWSPAPTEDETSEPLPEPTPEPTLGNDMVSVASEAAQDSAAPAVVDLLTTFFTAINRHDYDTYQSQQTPAAQRLLTRPAFTKGFRSTLNSEVNLLSLTPTTDGRLEAKLTFTSTQAAADGPQRQTCTHWSVSKFLKGDSPTLLIDKAPKSYKATYETC
jgi:hypothetical protein